MSDLGMLKAQHFRIIEAITYLKESISNPISEDKTFEIIQKLNGITAVLKFHIEYEDKYMYPYFAQNGSDEVKKIIKGCIDEMGNISVQFSDYKYKYNTKTKILNDVKMFISDTREIIEVLENRIWKEEMDLYKYL